MAESPKNGGPPKPAQRAQGSRFYRRYFEGYEEVSVPARDGSGEKTSLVYTADYYAQELSRKAKILLRAAYLLLFCGAAFCFGSAAAEAIPLNSCWYEAAAEAASLFFLGWTFWVFTNYVPAVGNMTVWEYRHAVVPLRKAVSGAWISLFAAAVLACLYLLLNPAEAAQPVLNCALRHAAAAAMMFVTDRAEASVRCVTVPNPGSGARSPGNSGEAGK